MAFTDTDLKDYVKQMAELSLISGSHDDVLDDVNWMLTAKGVNIAKRL